MCIRDRAGSENDSGFDIGRSFESFQKVIKQSGPAAAASYGPVVSILLFTFIGWYIDSIIDTSAIMSLIGLVVGMIIGFYHLVKTMTANKY